MIKDLKITNSKGDVFRFGRDNRMVSGLNLSGLSAMVSRFETNSPGSIYQRTRLEEREFDIDFNMIRRRNFTEEIMDEKRGSLYQVFNPNHNPFRLDFKTSNGDAYFLTAELTSSPIVPPDKSNNTSAWQKVLLQFIATDPFIYLSGSVSTDIALWIGAFEFPLDIPESGIEMGYRSESLFAEVFNEGHEVVGMTIQFRALGTVENPSIRNVNTQEELKLDFTMQGGDLIEIDTRKGKRSIILTRNNEKTNIFNTLAFETSTFLQLEPGDNLFRYDADDNLDNLEVRIKHTPRLIGV